MKRGGFKDPNSQRGMEIRHMQKKMDDCIYITILYTFVMVTTHQRFGTEVYNTKQEEPEGKPTKANQNKENRTQGQGSNGNTELSESKR